MSNPGAWGIILWVALPYLALGIFVLGHIWRWRYDQFGWTSRSTQLQERQLLKWGSPIFHYATFAAIGGHVLGILIPAAVTDFLGIPNHVYHLFAALAGFVAAVLVIAGVLVLAARRLFVARVRATTSPVDWVALILLLVIILTGVIPTVFNLFGDAYDYRATVGVWFRGLFMAQPHPTLMVTAPLLYQIHATASWLILAAWPFTRLVHAWSYPLWFLWRPYIVYRSRVPQPPNEPGTSGRKWRKIGSPY